MDTRVSRHYTHDIHQPSTPDKEVDREKKTPGGRGGEGKGGEGRIPKGRQIRKFKHAQILILAKCHLMAQYLLTEINSVSFGRFSSKINSVLTTYSSYCCMKRLASWLLPWMECCLLQLAPFRLSILFKLVHLHGKEKVRGKLGLIDEVA